MKISPMLKYKIAFWSITGPAAIILLIIMIPVLMIASIPKFRQSTLGWFDRLCNSFSEWRSNTYVKRYYYKANLFDILKG